ncbi:hypothetical protein GCM10007972_08120 [Iodidimonas muriae]|uniref:Uncharacterized protein n=1 Tax=Iodidimonas muriae TaxID=261467 RepID=A0ABQ2LCA5_9PROT|nr:hypothetical protein [Iodidimonas muriae]GER06071.1 hypothetical protein JCM17843_03810 [Kordiimonadales bacterium JCM 17843]GGO08114.1 hypothetical protein GCM10007972_08120 [Iodidimonas muriae]
MSTPLSLYKRRITIGFVLYTLAVFGANWMANNIEIPRLALVALALVPMIPALLVVRAILSFAKSWDEFQRKLAFEALLISVLVVGCGSFAWGFIEGIPDMPRLPAIWIMPALFGVYALARIFVSGRYR